MYALKINGKVSTQHPITNDFVSLQNVAAQIRTMQPGMLVEVVTVDSTGRELLLG